MSKLTHIEKQILDFINQVQDPAEIIIKIKDDPSFGKGSKRAYGIRKNLANEIIKERERLGGEFTSVAQIDRIKGIGKDTLHDIYYSFNRNSTNYPVVLFPVRLETRFKENMLCVRIYPDDICIDSHDKTITAEESKSIDTLRVLLNDASISNDDKKAGWRNIVGRYGLYRTNYLSKLGEERILRNGEIFSPKIYVLPSRFVVFVYRDGTPIFKEPGKDIPDELPLLRTTDSIDAQDTFFDENSRWISDFEAAKEVGMAVEIPIKGDNGPFERVVAVGIREDLSPQSAAKSVSDLFESHMYTKGLSFLNYGTPTNNTNASESGFSKDQNEETEESYDSVLLSQSETPIPNSNADIFSRVMGIPFDVTENMENAQSIWEFYSSHLRNAIWPGLGDYYLSNMLSGSITKDDRWQVWDHFTNYVYGRGYCPSIRIGKQPYGVMPARSQNEWKASAKDGFENDTIAADPAGFDNKLHIILKQLFDKYWLTMSQSSTVPNIGNPTDIDQELTAIFAMSPHSLSYHSRTFVDDRFVAFLLQTLGTYFFGENSGFDTASNEAVDYWTSKWAELWDNLENPPDQVLKDIATAIGLDDESLIGPALSNLFSWGNGRSITTSLIIDEYAESPMSYLNEFVNFSDDLPEANQGKPVLFELLRRSLAYQRSYDERKRLIPPNIRLERITFKANYESGQVFEILVDEGDVINKNDVIAKVFLAVFPSVPGIPPKAWYQDVKSPAGGKVVEIVSGVGTSIEPRVEIVLIRYEPTKPTEDRICAAVKEVVKAGLNESNMEGFVVDSMDLLTHRLDAWITSLANKRLLGMRKRTPSGIHIGAFGYVENLSKNDVSSGDIMQGNPGGYMHTPSMGQAATAALLRNAYLTHQDDSVGNAYRVNLSSKRVRRAMRIMQGLREGQELSELLGYQLERDLHEINLDFLIDEFRALYPLVAEKEIPLSDEADSDEAVEAIAARNIADGLAIARDYNETQSWDQVIHKLQGLLEDQIAIVLEEHFNNHEDKLAELVHALNNLRDTLDAINDTLIHESVFQIVQGNHERSGAALEAMNGQNRPPKLESIKTPTAAVNYGHRVFILFDAAPELLDDDNLYPRRCAEPRLDKWLSGILGPMDQIGCLVSFSEDSAEQTVTFSDLNLCALNLLSITADETSKSETDLDRYIKFFIRYHNHQIVESIDYNFRSDDHPRSMEETMELLRSIQKVLSVEKKYLTPCALSRPEGQSDENGEDIYVEDLFTERDFEELQVRINKVVASFMQVLSELRTATELGYELYSSLGQFKTIETLPAEPPENDEKFIEIKNSLLKQAEKIQNKASTAFAEVEQHLTSESPDYNKAISKLCDIARIYLGDSFVILPTFEPSNGAELAPTFSNSEALINHDIENVNYWLQQLAEVNPRIQQFEDMMTVTRAWQTARIDDDTGSDIELTEIDDPSAYQFHVAQLPHGICNKWIALPDADHDFTGLEERPRSITSFACYSGSHTRTILQENNYSDTRIGGLYIDAWDDKLPQFGQESEPGVREIPTQQTGISFQYDRPNAQAPQTILLAVPGADKDDEDWQLESLRNIVCETMDLAKIRAVDLDAFSKIGGIVPGLFLPVDEDTPGWMREVVMSSLEDLVVGETPCANIPSYVAGTGLGPKFDDIGMELISLGSGPALKLFAGGSYVFNYDGIELGWNDDTKGELFITISQISGLRTEPLPIIQAYDASGNVITSGYSESFSAWKRFSVFLDRAVKVRLTYSVPVDDNLVAYYFQSICIREPEQPAPIMEGEVYNGFLVKSIILHGAPAGDYTFRVYDRTEGRVYLFLNSTEITSFSYNWQTVVGDENPFRFSFEGYFDIDIGRSSGTSNLYGIGFSLFDGQKILHIE